MRYIFDASRAAVRRKRPGGEILLFRHPEIDHRFRAESSRGPAPDIFTFQRATRKVGGMFEFAGFGKVICPSLCAFSELVIPLERRHAHQQAFAVMRIEDALI